MCALGNLAQQQVAMKSKPTHEELESIEITPLVAGLSGGFSLPEHLDIREDHVEYLDEKFK